MKSIVERFLVIWIEERLEAKWLEGRTHVKADRWYTIRRTNDMRASEIELIQKLFPEYEVWLATGREFPDAGQISPMTKKAKDILKPTDKN
ncbi:MAG: hypothetical protein KBT77_07095 [Thalassolituus oleivorans]|uniref:hypothetical protein n=1 Tax=Thalassolituus oleivorans TaxID=187493 RepID=UPI0009F98A5F|nr:hypothetical protein [Thalassolituus oleivorans]MBQ0727096.1 hypothetical protein [Thalassolituus oleivorans]MBQ0781725.1 hypothetical protein [Thalassolituus oleivorans]